MYVKQQQIEKQLADNDLYSTERKPELAIMLEKKSALDKDVITAEEQWLDAQQAIEGIN